MKSLALLLSLLLSACTAPDFGDSEAGLALEDLAAGQAGSRLAALSAAPQRESVSFLTGAETRQADLYRSARAPRAGIVLVPGVVAEGWRDPRVVAIANTLARLDFTVLVPDNPGVRRFRVRERDVREVADSFAWLASQPGLAPSGHIGIAGFSYGAGPVLLAALQPDIRDQVAFLLSVGGYYSLENVVSFLTTGHYRAVEPAESADPVRESIRLSPHPYGLATFIRSNLDLLERSRDRGFFQRYAAYLVNNHAEENEPLPDRLAPDAQAFYDLLVNQSHARVPALLGKLPARIYSELQGINPAAHDISQLRAEVLLLHGRGDSLIPFTESIALADALPAGQVQLFLIDGLAHVNFRPRAHDVPKLLDVMQALLDQRVRSSTGLER